jgi:hypothetical protein
MNPLSHFLQSIRLAHHLKNDGSADSGFPEMKEMEATLKVKKECRQSRYPFAQQRVASIEAYMHHYHDMLLTERPFGRCLKRVGSFRMLAVHSILRTLQRNIFPIMPVSGC